MTMTHRSSRDLWPLSPQFCPPHIITTTRRTLWIELNPKTKNSFWSDSEHFIGWHQDILTLIGPLTRDVTTPTWHVRHVTVNVIDPCDLSSRPWLTLLKVAWGSGIREWIWSVRSRCPVCPVCDWWVPTVNTTFWWSAGAAGGGGGGSEGISSPEEVIYWFLNRCGICRSSYDWDKDEEM